MRFWCFIVLIISACSPETKNETAENTLWLYEAEVLKSGKSIPIDEYNKSIEKALSMRLPWAYSPLTIALRIAGQQMVSSELNVVSKSLSGNELVTHAVVLVEKKNLQDKRLQDQYFRVELKLGGSIWQVTQINTAWKCREGRGQQALSAEECK
ncbi:hypothetical protein [Marivirga lumbricoides]